MKRVIFAERRFAGPEPFKGRLFIHFLISHVQGAHCRVGKVRARCNPRRLFAGDANRACA